MSLAASGLPAGATATFTPATLAAGGVHDEYHHDGQDSCDCHERAATVSLRAAAACAGNPASSSGNACGAQAVAANSSIPGSGAVCSARPGGSYGTERVFGGGPFRSEKSSLLHHGYGHRRNSSAHSRGAPCDPVGEVRVRVVGRGMRRFLPLMATMLGLAPGLHGQIAPGGRDFSLPRAEVSLAYSPTEANAGPGQCGCFFMNGASAEGKFSHLSRLYHGGRCNRGTYRPNQ